jgi:hypothetical protein
MTATANPDSYDATGPLTVAPPGVLENDVYTDQPFTSVDSGPSHGTLQMFIDGSFIYTPVAGFTGSDTFVYQLQSGSDTDTATVTITVALPHPIFDPLRPHRGVQ